MAEDVEKLYNDRMERYCTAMKNAKPDKVPTRLFAAEAAGKFLGYNAQDVTHDVDKGLDAVIEMCKVLNLDATVVNMVYVWTGMTESYGTRYYKVPGIDIDEDEPFQYWEPSCHEGKRGKEGVGQKGARFNPARHSDCPGGDGVASHGRYSRLT